MQPKLLYDIVIPPLGEWPDEAIGDPLHPIHGPLPELAQVWRYGEWDFKAALWVSPLDIYVMIEWLKEDPGPHLPPLTRQETRVVKGWIVQSYRWKQAVDKKSYSCFDVRVVRPSIKDEDVMRRRVCEDILRASVMFAVNKQC